jgi:hypothetical protein
MQKNKIINNKNKINTVLLIKLNRIINKYQLYIERAVKKFYTKAKIFPKILFWLNSIISIKNPPAYKIFRNYLQNHNNFSQL